MPRLSLYVLGPPRVELDGVPVTSERRKALALLVYLACTARPHTREALAALLWPEHDTSRALAYLRRALWEINRALRNGWVNAARDLVQLKPGSEMWVDAAHFQALLDEARQAQPCGGQAGRLAEAVALYADDFLAGFSLKDAPAFDEWVFFQAEELRRGLAGALERLVACRLDEGGAADETLPYARRWLALDPLNEAAHRALMRAYAAAGQLAAALAQYQECARRLQVELGEAPEPETTALYERLRRAAATPPERAAEPAEPPPTAPAPAAPAARGLPQPPSPFVGREAELAQLGELLAGRTARLITLVGPGGVGKTRLAIQAAGQHREAFADGAFFVPLASVHDPDFMVPAIASAVGFSFFSQALAGDQPMQTQQLLGYLAEKQMLLVLDNVEQLLAAETHAAATGLLAGMLEAAPGLSLLTTSRERLNVRDEWVLVVDGLRLPAEDSGPAALASGAVRLFVHQAQKALVGYTPAEADVPHIVRICRLVHGLPLGIELAAAWVKTLSLAEIADEIERSVDFLITPLRDTPERHRSLRAVFDYSWQLLPPAQQAAFRRLAVFAGGFDRQAAQAVAGATLSVLAALVDKSLLYRGAAGRYVLHEMLRQYAFEQLAANPAEHIQTLDRHAAYYAGLVRDSRPALLGRGQRAALEHLGASLENIRAGWRHALSQRDHASLQPYLDGLFWFYEMRSRFQEGEDLAAEALRVYGDPDAPEPAAELAVQLLAWHAHFCYRLGRIQTGADHMRRALYAVRRAGRPHNEAAALVLRVALSWGDFGGPVEGVAEQVARETLEYYRQRGDRWGEAQVLTFLAMYQQGHNPSAESNRLLQAALALQREIGDDWGASFTYQVMGEALHHAGQFAEARRAYEASLALAEALGDRWAMSVALDYSGFVARRMGDLDEARRRHEASLAISRETGDQLGIAGSLDNLGLVAFDEHNYAEAERLFAAGLELRRQVGQHWSLAVSLEHMAWAAMAQGNYARADEYLAEALRYSPDWVMIHVRRGHLSRLQGQPAQARARFAVAMAIVLQWRDPPKQLEILAGLAQVLAMEGRLAEAAELAALVAAHPATEHAVRAVAQRMLDEAVHRLPPAELAAARARGQAANLEAVATAFAEGEA